MTGLLQGVSEGWHIPLDSISSTCSLMWYWTVFGKVVVEGYSSLVIAEQFRIPSWHRYLSIILQNNNEGMYHLASD